MLATITSRRLRAPHSAGSLGTSLAVVPRRRVPVRHAGARRHAAAELRPALHRRRSGGPTSSCAATTRLDTDGEVDAGPHRRVARRPSVAASTASPRSRPQIEGFGQLVGDDGEKLGGNGPPHARRQLDRRPRRSTRTSWSRAGRRSRRRGRDQPRRRRRTATCRSATSTTVAHARAARGHDRRHRHVRRRGRPRARPRSPRFTLEGAAAARHRAARRR